MFYKILHYFHIIYNISIAVKIYFLGIYYAPFGSLAWNRTKFQKVSIHYTLKAISIMAAYNSKDR